MQNVGTHICRSESSSRSKAAAGATETAELVVAFWMVSQMVFMFRARVTPFEAPTPTFENKLVQYHYEAMFKKVMLFCLNDFYRQGWPIKR